MTLNILKRKKLQNKYQSELVKKTQEFEKLLISDEILADEQLKMMFVCCHPSISENSQIALILKILCGFSISEIANAFFSTKQTINKRLVRGRKQLRKNKVDFEIPNKINEKLKVVLKTIYLLFNEGYSPSRNDEPIRYDLCLEAIRLVEILADSGNIKQKADCYASLALMYLNASRFASRVGEKNTIIEMGGQDRQKWNQELINKGIANLNLATQEKQVSTYLILATISANHCIAPSFEQTDWVEILSLYDSLIEIENSPIAKLNRCVALSKVKGNQKAILELKNLELESDIADQHLFHSTLAELFTLEKQSEKAIEHYKKAISSTQNKRDLIFLEKKLREVVPI